MGEGGLPNLARVDYPLALTVRPPSQLQARGGMAGPLRRRAIVILTASWCSLLGGDAATTPHPSPPTTLLWPGSALLRLREAGAHATEPGFRAAVSSLLAVANASAGLCVVEPGVEYGGHDLEPSRHGACTDTGGGLPAASAESCCELCQESGCHLWSFTRINATLGGKCCFKYSDAGRRNSSSAVSGRGRAPPSILGPWSVMDKSAVATSGDPHDYLQYGIATA